MCSKEQPEGCQKPENLSGEPQDCSPEQIRACHGDAGDHACAGSGGCQHPERLQGRPGDCSPDQIRACHGDAGGHQCPGV